MSKLLVIMNKATKLVQKWYLFECQRQRKWIAMKRDVGAVCIRPQTPYWLHHGISEDGSTLLTTPVSKKPANLPMGLL